jgi:hypothetical protein
LKKRKKTFNGVPMMERLGVSGRIVCPLFFIPFRPW